MTGELTVLLETQRARNQLRIAAIERRLDAHQNAYSLWRKLIVYVHKPEIVDVVTECQHWWDENCLYLSNDARKAFHDAYQSAYNHKNYLQDRSKPDMVEENWERIMTAGSKIVEGAELPSLGADESEVIDNTDQNT